MKAAEPEYPVDKGYKRKIAALRQLCPGERASIDMARLARIADCNPRYISDFLNGLAKVGAIGYTSTGRLRANVFNVDHSSVDAWPDLLKTYFKARQVGYNRMAGRKQVQRTPSSLSFPASVTIAADHPQRIQAAIEAARRDGWSVTGSLTLDPPGRSITVG